MLAYYECRKQEESIKRYFFMLLLMLLYSSNAAEIRTEKNRGLKVAPIGNRTFKQACRRRVALCVGITTTSITLA